MMSVFLPVSLPPSLLPDCIDIDQAWQTLNKVLWVLVLELEQRVNVNSFQSEPFRIPPVDEKCSSALQSTGNCYRNTHHNTKMTKPPKREQEQER